MLNKYADLLFVFIFFSAIFFVNIAIANNKSTLSKQYDDYVNEYPKKNVSFGHDVDIQGKLIDLAKTYVDKSSIGGEKWAKIKKVLINEFDLATTAQKRNLTISDMNIFLAKTLLPYIKGGEHLSQEKLDALTGPGISFTEIGASGLGSSLGGSKSKKVAEGIALGVLDTLCASCAVTRRAVLLGYETARAGEAWVEDQATQDEFKRWDEGSRFKEEFMVLPGQSQVYRNAKRVLMKARGCTDHNKCDISKGDVMGFIEKQFKKWQQEKIKTIEEARVLADAKDEFLNQKGSQLASFGQTDLDKVKNFSTEFIETYNDLLSHRPDKLAPLGIQARKKLIEATIYLLTKRNRSMVDYKKFFANQLRRLGWKKGLVVLTKEQEKARATHVKSRLIRLNHAKLQKVIDFMGIKNIPKKFYSCLCVGAGYGSSGTTQFYLPPSQFIEPYNERYSCQHSGGPCVVSGGGCLRYPFPSDVGIWDRCMNSYRLGMKKDEKGNTIMQKDKKGNFIKDESGNTIPVGDRLDDYIAKKLNR